MKNLNLYVNAYWYIQRCKEVGKTPSIVFFAREQQKLVKSERKRTADEFANVLGYQLIPRKKTSQYRYKKFPRVKINGKGYSIQPKDD